MIPKLSNKIVSQAVESLCVSNKYSPGFFGNRCQDLFWIHGERSQVNIDKNRCKSILENGGNIGNPS